MNPDLFVIDDLKSLKSLEDAEKQKQQKPIIIANHNLRKAIQALQTGKRPHTGNKQLEKGLRNRNRQKERAIQERIQKMKEVHEVYTEQETETTKGNGGSESAAGSIQQDIQSTS